MVDKNKRKAFPMVGWDDGMSLREFYAATALIGIISNKNTPAPDWDRCASNAFEAADAMMRYEENEEKNNKKTD